MKQNLNQKSTEYPKISFSQKDGDIDIYILFNNKLRNDINIYCAKNNKGGSKTFKCVGTALDEKNSPVNINGKPSVDYFAMKINNYEDNKDLCKQLLLKLSLKNTNSDKVDTIGINGGRMLQFINEEEYKHLINQIEGRFSLINNGECYEEVQTELEQYNKPIKNKIDITYALKNECKCCSDCCLL